MSKDYKNELNEMYRLMNYGMNESKTTNNPKAIVEYSQLGADGQTYGILREGTKYFVKVAPKKNTAVLAEDYDYIGGFNNRKAFDSYTKASQELNFKLMSVNESANSKKSVSQYNLNESAEWQVGTTKEMRGELNRFYQLCSNVDNLLSENVHYIKENDSKNGPYNNKPTTKDGGGCNGPCGKQQNLGIKDKDGGVWTGKVNAESTYEKNGVQGKSPSGEYKMGDHNVASGNPYQSKATTSKEQGKSISENVEDWRRGFVHNSEEDLVDRHHGTEIGDTAPWTDKVNVNEDENDWGSAGLPSTPGIGDAKKYKEPFETNTKQPMTEEYIFEVEMECGQCEDVNLNIPDGMTVDVTGEPMGNEMGDDFGGDNAMPMNDDMGMDNGMANEPMTTGMDNGMGMEQDPMKQNQPMNENTLNDFGKHPAYQKQVMSLPPNGDGSKWGRDWNDESTKGDEPYGKQIGHSGDPFTDTVNTITNAVVTALTGKKKD